MDYALTIRLTLTQPALSYATVQAECHPQTRLIPLFLKPIDTVNLSNTPITVRYPSIEKYLYVCWFLAA